MQFAAEFQHTPSCTPYCRALDPPIFNGLAHEAVLAATAAVQEAARILAKVGRGGHAWGVRAGVLCELHVQGPTPPLISRCFSRCPAVRVLAFG